MSEAPSPRAPAAERQLAWFRARVASEGAEATFVALCRAGHAVVLARPLGEVVAPAALADALDAVLSERVVRDLAGPVARRIFDEARSRAAKDAEPAARFVPERARARLDELLARADLLPERVVREVLEQEAVEHILRDVLYDALQTFSAKVNPFFAEWGLPSLLKRVMPIGASTVMKSLEGVKAEFDRRLEPEIAKFLQPFSRVALGRIASEVVRQQGDPRFVALRREILRWLLAQPVADLAALHEEGAQRALLDATLDVAAEVSALDEVRRSRRALVDELVAELGARSLGELLGESGATPLGDVAELARAAWPATRAVLLSDEVAALFANELAAFFAADATTG